jgi:diacylglycerol kinase (ATP)
MNDNREKAFLIVNPVGGNNKAIDMLPVVDDIFSKLGADIEIQISRSPDQATDLAYMASRCGFKRIIAMGGDGTINKVAAGLIGSDSIMGVIPAGNGNDFFKMLNIESNLDTICKTAIFGDNLELDVGVINNLAFFNMVGIGFDAEVAAEANNMNRNMGLLTYLLAVIKVWKRFPTFKVKMRIDSHEISEQVMLVAVGIGRSAGGGFFLTPNALVNDGKFDVCIVKTLNRLRFFPALLKIIKGAHIRLPETQIYRCRQLSVISDEALPVHYEGETFTSRNGKIIVKMSPLKLKVAARL